MKMTKQNAPRRMRSFAMALLAGLAANAAHAEPVLWVDDSAGRLGKVDVQTGAVSVVGQMGTVMTDIAFDPHGHLYGVTFDALYRINPDTAATTLIGNLGTSINALVFSSDGTLYGANNALYTIDTSTGAAAAVGRGGVAYNSSGDLAFVGGNLYLSSATPVADTLVRIDPATGAAASVGPLGTSGIYGLASNDNVHLYGVASTNVYQIDPLSGAGTLRINYGGQGLGAANGTAFFAEAVPEPETYALLLAGLGVVGGMASRRRGRTG